MEYGTLALQSSNSSETLLNKVDGCTNSDTSNATRTNTSTCGCSKANRTNSAGHKNFYVLLLTFFVILHISQHVSGMSSFLCHSKVKCLNGGVMHIPVGPFDFCRCSCPKRFVGLRCEFNRMYPGRRTRRINRLKRLVKLRNEVGYLLSDRRRHRHAQRWWEAPI